MRQALRYGAPKSARSERGQVVPSQAPVSAVRCGHRVEGIPVPDTDGRWRLIVVEGEAQLAASPPFVFGPSGKQPVQNLCLQVERARFPPRKREQRHSEQRSHLSLGHSC